LWSASVPPTPSPTKQLRPAVAVFDVATQTMEIARDVSAPDLAPSSAPASAPAPADIAGLQAAQIRDLETLLAHAETGMATAEERVTKAEAALAACRGDVAALTQRVRALMAENQQLTEAKEAVLDEVNDVIEDMAGTKARLEAELEQAQARCGEARARAGELQGQLQVSRERVAALEHDGRAQGAGASPPAAVLAPCARPSAAAEAEWREAEERLRREVQDMRGQLAQALDAIAASGGSRSQAEVGDPHSPGGASDAIVNTAIGIQSFMARGFREAALGADGRMTPFAGWETPSKARYDLLASLGMGADIQAKLLEDPFPRERKAGSPPRPNPPPGDREPACGASQGTPA